MYKSLPHLSYNGSFTITIKRLHSSDLPFTAKGIMLTSWHLKWFQGYLTNTQSLQSQVSCSTILQEWVCQDWDLWDNLLRRYDTFHTTKWWPLDLKKSCRPLDILRGFMLPSQAPRGSRFTGVNHQYYRTVNGKFGRCVTLLSEDMLLFTLKKGLTFLQNSWGAADVR